MLEAATKNHVQRVARNLREDSDPKFLNPQGSGKVGVVGVYYYLASGTVDFFDVV